MDIKKDNRAFLWCKLALAILCGNLAVGFFLGVLVTTSLADSPSVLTVTPSQSPNNFDTSIVIHGTDFQVVLSGTEVLTAPVVRLGDNILSLAHMVTSRTLTATVPWGLEEGVYPIYIENSDGTTATLTNGFTVTAGLGVWTTGGPYGGSVVGLAMDADISTTLYANLDFMGLYKSDNSGEVWRNIFAGYVTRFTHKPDDPQTIYLSGDVAYQHKLLRSTDGGDTWEPIWDGRAWDLGVSPGGANYLYLINGSTITRSVDGGNTWTPAGTLPSPPSLDDPSVSALAVHPVTPTIVYAGIYSGEIYKTTDGGEHWTATSANFGETWWNHLVIDPHSPERIYATGWHGVEFFARSDDGGANWQTTLLDTHVSHASDIQFHPTISGTMVALTMEGIYSSTNAGITWDKQDGTPQGWRVLLNPQTGSPFLIGHNGQAILRSDDEGLTWQARNEGMPGVQPTDIASSPADPRYVYLAADDAGGFVSNNNGQSWQAVNLPELSNAVAADPYTPTVAYLGGQYHVYKTVDGGQNWVEAELPGLVELDDSRIRINSIEIDPADAQVLYAGAGTWDMSGDVEHGWLYHSLDAGATWNVLTVSLPISPVTDIEIDPTDSLVIYISTGRRWLDSTDKGSGVIKSTDGGISWEYINEGITATNISRLAFNPHNPQILYAGANLPTFDQDGGLYKTTDGGLHWTQVMQWLRISGLEVDPLEPNTIYAGSYWAGLFRSTDAGGNWSRVDSALGHLSSLCLDVIEVQNRTVVYAGVSGGIVEVAVAGASDGVQVMDNQLFGSGAYQLTVDHRNSVIFLPLIIR